jgi:hypothetical protein
MQFISSFSVSLFLFLTLSLCLHSYYELIISLSFHYNNTFFSWYSLLHICFCLSDFVWSLLFLYYFWILSSFTFLEVDHKLKIFVSSWSLMSAFQGSNVPLLWFRCILQVLTHHNLELINSNCFFNYPCEIFPCILS